MRTAEERTDHVRTMIGLNGQAVEAPAGMLAGYRLGSWDDVMLCADCIAVLSRFKAQHDGDREAGKGVIERIQQVYFIGAESGPVKIGVAMDVKKRLAALQTSHHERLSVLASRPGTPADEREYHNRFAEHRLHGEWFKRSPSIESEIERLGGGA